MFSPKRILQTSCLLLAVSIGSSAMLSAESQDPYVKYINTSKDFKTVKQDKDWAYKAWPSWTFMPWYYKWDIGHNDAAGRFSRETGYNGAFIDRGNTDYLGWINKFHLRFYNDHTAGKGDLHLDDKGDKDYLKKNLPGTGMRKVQINDSLFKKLSNLIKKTVNQIKGSPYRAAYALDDEISWGSFIRPCMWRITDDGAYRDWLEEIYGKGNAPKNPGWIGYDKIRTQLSGWKLKDFDCSQLMDQWTFNDSYWNNFIGDLVEYTNSVDPDTPAGFVGAQSPNSFGGFDYAKVMRKVQFIEAYGLDDTQNVIRSFNPHQALPTVSTFFFGGLKDMSWQMWYGLAKGNRGHIGWVEGWFKGKDPKPWHAKIAPTLREIGDKISPKMEKFEFADDQVAIYYNHASIQMSWILDSEAHGKTWPNRNDDDSRGTYHMMVRAWRKMLQDEGLQFTFINYVDVIQNGVPDHYKVLILPATYCLSDAEAQRIREFVKNGGTLVSDFMPGLFDQHGKARPNGGVLDDVFGVKQDMDLKAHDVFGKKLWVEVDQDAHWSDAKKFEKNLSDNSSVKDSSGFNKAVAKMSVNNKNKFGKGQAFLLNLSPQWYNAYRQSGGMKASEKRSTFMDPVESSGVKPWVRIKNAGEAEFGYEIAYWVKDGRTILFVVSNPDSSKSALGGGNSAGLKSEKLNITLKFDKTMKNIVNERTGKKLKDGDEVKVEWQQEEAVVLSFDGEPHK